MVAAITKKRSKMAKKDTLLEEAALSAAGIQQTHVIGIFALLMIFICLFGIMGLKHITWIMLLCVNVVFFIYLMKLTIDSGFNAPLGPDGQPIEGDDSSDDDDDDDDEYQDDDEEGEYKPPATPERPTGLPPIS